MELPPNPIPMVGGFPCCTEEPQIPAEAFSFSKSFIDLADAVAAAVDFVDEVPSDMLQRSSKLPPLDLAGVAGVDLIDPGDVTFDLGGGDVGEMTPENELNA
jgi:hypothetical protein